MKIFLLESKYFSRDIDGTEVDFSLWSLACKADKCTFAHPCDSKRDECNQFGVCTSFHNIDIERLLARMNSDVSRQFVLRAETLPAPFTAEVSYVLMKDFYVIL